MSRSTRQLIALVVPFALFTAACGSSGNDVAAPVVDPGQDPANSSAPASVAAGGDPAVEAYCTAVDEYVDSTKQMIADPTSVDATALGKQATDLIAAAATLIASTTEADSARLQECNNKFSDVGS